MNTELSASTHGRVHSTDLILQDGYMDKIKSYAELMSATNMIPSHFAGNQLDLAIVVSKAITLGLDPVAMSHEVFPVKNKMTYGSKLIIAMIHGSKMVLPRTFIKEVGDWDNLKLSKNTNFHGGEKGLGVKVGFQYVGDASPTYGSTLYLEPQVNRNSPLWKTDPMQQLVYLAAKRWSSIHMPSVTMGMMMEDEVRNENSHSETNVSPSIHGNVEQSQEAVFAPETVVAINPTKSPEEVKDTSIENQINIEDESAEFTEIIDSVDINKSTSKAEGEKALTVEKAMKMSKEFVDGMIDSAEKAAKEPELPKAPIDGDLDEKGNKFDSRTHTGKRLPSGEWRLSKKGKELVAQWEEDKEEEERKEAEAAKALEEAKEVAAKETESEVIEPSTKEDEAVEETEAEEAETEEVQAYDHGINKGDFVKCASQEAIDVIGTSSPIQVNDVDNEDGTIEITVNNNSEWYPVVYEGSVMFEKCDAPESADAVQKSKESCDAIINQRKKCTASIEAKLDLIIDCKAKEEAKKAIQKWEKNAKNIITKVGVKGTNATQEEFETAGNANKSYWSESLSIIKRLKESLESQESEEENPFA